MSCSPTYTYQPTQRPIQSQSTAPSFVQSRSRLFAGGTYFRSIEQGLDQNDISLQCEVTTGSSLTSDITLVVRVAGTTEETFNVTQVIDSLTGNCISGGISALRAIVNSTSLLIEMFPRNTDFFDIGGVDDLTGCVSAFSHIQLAGGNGPPANASQSFLDSIFTGKQRTIIIIQTREDIQGFPSDPPPNLRVQQYDGVNFISYCNNTPGSCPLEGTC